MTTTRKPSSLPISANGNESNPFSLETIRARKQATFPDILVPLSKRERTIMAQGREEILGLGLTALKGRYATQEVVRLELVAQECFFDTTLGIEQQLRKFLEACGDEQFQFLGTIFAHEGVKRMGGAIAGIVDAAETNMRNIVERSYDFDQKVRLSLLQRLFSGQG